MTTPRQHYDSLVAGHTLVPVQLIGPVLCFYLEGPKGLPDFEVTVTPKGIYLYCPQFSPPVMHARDMTFETWVGEASTRWLAKTFLSKSWDSDHARAHYREMLATLRQLRENGSNEAAGFFDQLADAIESDACDSAVHWQRAFGDILDEMVEKDLFEQGECYPTDVYDNSEILRLAAYHRRFRDLFLAEYQLVDDGKRITLASR